MNLKNYKQLIKQQALVKGDGTYRLNFKEEQLTLTNVELKKGYWVALFPLSKATSSNILMVEWGELYIGVWNKHIDITCWVSNKQEAIKLAKLQHQKAIWDNKNNKDIYIK